MVGSLLPAQTIATIDPLSPCLGSAPLPPVPTEVSSGPMALPQRDCELTLMVQRLHWRTPMVWMTMPSHTSVGWWIKASVEARVV